MPQSHLRVSVRDWEDHLSLWAYLWRIVSMTKLLEVQRPSSLWAAQVLGLDIGLAMRGGREFSMHSVILSALDCRSHSYLELRSL